MGKAWWASAAILLLASGCQTIREVPQTHGHPSRWSAETRAVAAETYSYALMANNAYAAGHVDLGPDLHEIGGDPAGPCGFAYRTFERRSGGRAVEVILAYRGTEFTDPGDWLCGNLLGTQNRSGLAAYDSWRDRTPRHIPVNVTGHSLGGGIATFVSINRSRVNSYAFNSSPRFWRRGRQQENRRISVVENGEILNLARLFGREATQLYVSLGCSRGNPVSQHAMLKLAGCLTEIAAIGCAEARSARDRNLSLRRPNGPWPREPGDEAGRRCIRMPVDNVRTHPVHLIQHDP